MSLLTVKWRNGNIICQFMRKNTQSKWVESTVVVLGINARLDANCRRTHYVDRNVVLKDHENHHICRDDDSKVLSEVKLPYFDGMSFVFMG